MLRAVSERGHFNLMVVNVSVAALEEASSAGSAVTGTSPVRWAWSRLRKGDDHYVFPFRISQNLVRGLAFNEGNRSSVPVACERFLPSGVSRAELAGFLVSSSSEDNSSESRGATSCRLSISLRTQARSVSFCRKTSQAFLKGSLDSKGATSRRPSTSLRTRASSASFSCQTSWMPFIGTPWEAEPITVSGSLSRSPVILPNGLANRYGFSSTSTGEHSAFGRKIPEKRLGKDPNLLGPGK